MRAMECPLEGHHLEADNDEELFKETRKHADEIHPRERVHRRAASLSHRGERLREVANQHLGLGHHTPVLPRLPFVHPTS
jgi:hypothetical protein